MNDYVLTCCSTADMSNDYLNERHIPYVCFHYTIDGQTYADDRGQSMRIEDFFDRMSRGALPKTSQVNVEEYKDFFGPFLEAGKDILHVSLSSGISGAYSSAMTAKYELLAQYPERRIVIVDSLGASSGYGLLMDMLADRRDGGASLEEIRSWAEENKLNVHHWFFSTDLTFYIKGGRVSKTAGMLGTMLKICPLLNMDAQGHLIPREKIRSKKKVIAETVKKMVEHADGGLDYGGKCCISHSACYADARAVADLVEKTFLKLNGPVLINNIGTVIGSHTGPGTVALYFLGDKRQ